MNIKELKSILKENNIKFYTYWDKKRLVSLANEHNLLPKKEISNEKIEDVNYDRLKTIKRNPRKVILENIETGEIINFPSIYKAAKFIDKAPLTITHWGNKEGVWNNKYKVTLQ